MYSFASQEILGTTLVRAPFFSNLRILWEPIPALKACGLCYGETKGHDGMASQWNREDRDPSPESKALTQEPVKQIKGSFIPL